MTSTIAGQKKYTIEEYFALASASREKLEYYNGKIIPMPGGTPIHNEIALKVGAVLLQLVKPLNKKYKVYNSDMKIWVGKHKLFVYPDAVVVCEAPVLYEGRKDAIINPLLIVEVLSPGTEEYDRSNKFLEYQTLPSFKEYVYLSQKAVEGTVMFLEAEGLWRRTEAEGAQGMLPLRSLGCELPLADVYEGVEFE